MSTSTSTPRPAHAEPDAAERHVSAFDVRPTAHPTPPAERDARKASPVFGTVFTDHMARITWSAADGWHDRRIEAYGPIAIDPATAVLHYGQEIFEGLKVYGHGDGTAWTFRPEANAARFARSARRLALPELPAEDFVASVTALVRADVDWIPGDEESSLYLRPFLYASEVFLGVRPSRSAEYIVIASPTGPYFAGGVHPVSIWVDREYSRAGVGGTGAAKCGGNYAASLLPQLVAAEHGCEQVCFLDAETRTYLEELGGMNVVVVRADGSLETPELTGSILEGVTRSSILKLAADRGHEVRERRLPLAEVVAGIADGSVTEVFACGTAAVITPIGRLAGSDFDLTIGAGAPGSVTMALRQELTDIQTGRAADRYGWMRRIA